LVIFVTPKTKLEFGVLKLEQS